MKIKINWGTGIVIAMILFMAFILQYVYRAVTYDKYNYELVSKDYYKDELYYQKEIDKLNNANQLEQNIHLEHNGHGYVIHFPKNMDFSKISGIVYFQRPSDKSLDFQQNILLNDSKLLVTHTNLVEGKWKIKIDWKYGDEEYLYKKTVFY